MSQKVTNGNYLTKYFTQIPNIIDDSGLDVYEFRLLLHYYRVGECWEGVRTTAQKCKVSVGKVVEVRKSLSEKGFIEIQQNKDGVTITVVDKYAENSAKYTRSPHEQGVSPGEQTVSPHELKNNLLIITQEEDNTIAETKVSAFKRCVELYDQFCKKRLNVGCKMNGAEGKAMKEIIKYLIANSPNKSEDEAVLAFEHILADWDKLDKFLITQIRLTQINQNLPNIINIIRNGKSQSRGSTYEALEQLKEMQRNFETSGSDSQDVPPGQSSYTRHEPVNDIHRGRGFD